MSDEQIWGTVKFSWCISERDAKVPQGDDDLTPEQVKALLERLEEAVSGAIPQEVRIYIDGEDQEPVTVAFDLGAAEYEIDEGPIVGEFSLIRMDHG